MAFDFADSLQKFIHSPPGQLAAGGVLAGIVWKSFERVEAVLNDTTKLEIAVWLVGVNVGQKLGTWPETFVAVFDRVFGRNHLSFRCFWRSSLASILGVVLISFSMWLINPRLLETLWLLARNDPKSWILGIFVANILPDYISLLETRFILSLMHRVSLSTRFLYAPSMLCLLIFDIVFTYGVALTARHFGSLLVIFAPKYIYIGSPSITAELDSILNDTLLYALNAASWLWLYPAFFTSVWLWLYAGSGFLLKAARRFDLGFDLFNRTFDIEKKPLSSIGLVAGALVAVAYWGFTIAVNYLSQPTHFWNVP